MISPETCNALCKQRVHIHADSRRAIADGYRAGQTLKAFEIIKRNVPLLSITYPWPSNFKFPWTERTEWYRSVEFKKKTNYCIWFASTQRVNNNFYLILHGICDNKFPIVTFLTSSVSRNDSSYKVRSSTRKTSLFSIRVPWPLLKRSP